MPAASVEVENVAVPLPFRLPLPICVVPSRKFTVPVGTPEVPDATFADSAMLWFKFAELGAFSAVVVAAFWTTWLSAVEALPVKFESPEYVAVME